MLLRILITGATGFVGRWVAKALSEQGAEVFCIARNSSSTVTIGQPLFLDIFDPVAVERAVSSVKPEIVLHAAWDLRQTDIYNSATNLDWIRASIQLIRVSADAGVRRFVGVGSCAEYAAPPDRNCEESTTPMQPTTLYGASKDAIRRTLSSYSSVAGFSFAWGVLFYMYGPDENERRLVPTVCNHVLQNTPPKILSGEAVRDFLHVRDVGYALAALALSDVTGPVNIGSGQGVRVRSIADEIAKIAKRPHLIETARPDGDLSEAPRIVADIRRLTEEVGYTPSYTLQEGLADAYTWWRDRAHKVSKN